MGRANCSRPKNKITHGEKKKKKKKKKKKREEKAGFDLQVAASNTLETDQFRKNTAEVATPRILWARVAEDPSHNASASTITRRRKKDKTFFDKEGMGHRGATKSDRGCGEMDEVKST